MTLTQVHDFERFPSGDMGYLAQTVENLEQIAKRFDLTWNQGSDDFDSYHEAAFKIDGDHMVFFRYDGMPDPWKGVVIYCDSKANFTDTFKRFKEESGYTDDDLSWVSPFVDGYEQYNKEYWVERLEKIS